MNVSELLERVYQATGYTDRFYVLGLLNDALRSLTDAARMETTVTLTTKKGVADLPADFKAPIAVFEGTLSMPDALWEQVQWDDIREGYLLYGEQVHLRPAVDKKLTLLYYRYAPELIEDEDVPAIDTRWHSLLATYATLLVQALPQVEVDNNVRNLYRLEWEEGKRSFNESIARLHRKSRVREVNRW